MGCRWIFYQSQCGVGWCSNIIQGKIELLQGVDLAWTARRQSGVELAIGGFKEDEVAPLSSEVWACTR